MARLSQSQSHGQDEPAAASYHYDPKLGDPHAAFTPADVAHPEVRRPEIPARFVVRVEGETIINTMWGKRIVPWRSEPGTPCIILGYWADGTVHLRWPAIVGHYRVDGRFPAWVVTDRKSTRLNSSHSSISYAVFCLKKKKKQKKIKKEHEKVEYPSRPQQHTRYATHKMFSACIQKHLR